MYLVGGLKKSLNNSPKDNCRPIPRDPKYNPTSSRAQIAKPITVVNVECGLKALDSGKNPVTISISIAKNTLKKISHLLNNIFFLTSIGIVNIVSHQPTRKER